MRWHFESNPEEMSDCMDGGQVGSDVTRNWVSGSVAPSEIDPPGSLRGRTNPEKRSSDGRTPRSGRGTLPFLKGTRGQV